ncbi:MAG: tetratricopeptide repeat protein [Gammaproteobacteria bacterium]
MLVLPVQADYEKGVDAYFREDYATALSEFTRVAEQGDSNAQYNVALMYLKGEGTGADLQQALHWFRAAAAAGQLYAQGFLGALYADGQGVPQDDRLAAYWLGAAARGGHAPSQYFLGRLYLHGRGVPRDDVQAYLWLGLAVNNGYADALSLRDRTGRGLTAGELATAERLVEEHWAQNDPSAQAKTP